MATRELMNQEDAINAIKFRDASERPLFRCPEHKEEIRVVAEGTETRVTLTGCCDRGFDEFLEDAKRIIGWTKVFENQ